MALPPGAKPYTGEILPLDTLPEGAKPYTGEIFPLERPTRAEKLTETVAGGLRSMMDVAVPSRAEMDMFFKPDREILRAAGVGIEQFNKGIANLGQLLTGVDVPGLFARIGIKENLPPETVAERFIGAMSREAGAAATGAGILGLAGRFFGGSASLLGKALQEVAKRPGGIIATEAGMGAGAGAGMQAVEEVLPENDLAQIAGGVGGAMLAGMRRTPSNPAAERIAGMTARQGEEVGSVTLPEAERRIREGIGAIGEVLPEVRPTLGQTVDSRTLAATERSLAKMGTPAEQGTFADRYAGQREATRQDLRTTGGPDLGPEEAGRAIRDPIAGRYNALLDARKKAVDSLYEDARLSQTPVDTGPVFATLDDMKADARGAALKALKEVESALKVGGKRDDTARGLIAARKEIDRLISTRGEGAYDSNIVRMLTRVKESLDQSLEAVPAFKQATREFQERSIPLAPFQAKEGAPTVERILGTVARTSDEFKVPTSEVGRQFVGPGRPQPETWKELVRAAGGNKTDAVEAAKNVLEQRLVSESSTAQGPTADKLGGFVVKNRELLREVYGPEHVAKLNQIANALRRMELPQRQLASGSETGALIAPSMSRLEQSVIGKALNRVGQLNPLSAARFGREAFFRAVESKDARYQQIIRDAFLNPELAADLIADLNTRRGRAALDRLNTYTLSLGAGDESE